MIILSLLKFEMRESMRTHKRQQCFHLCLTFTLSLKCSVSYWGYMEKCLESKQGVRKQGKKKPNCLYLMTWISWPQLWRLLMDAFSVHRIFWTSPDTRDLTEFSEQQQSFLLVCILWPDQKHRKKPNWWKNQHLPVLSHTFIYSLHVHLLFNNSQNYNVTSSFDKKRMLCCWSYILVPSNMRAGEDEH